MNELPIMLSSNKSLIHKDCVEKQTISTKKDPACETDQFVQRASSGLDKLQLMTAIDFHNDQYARYSIHESEIKDSVRTNTYKNCIEYCSKNYIKVNLFSYTI